MLYETLETQQMHNKLSLFVTAWFTKVLIIKSVFNEFDNNKSERNEIKIPDWKV